MCNTLGECVLQQIKRDFPASSHPLSRGCCLAPCVSVQVAFCTALLCHCVLRVTAGVHPNSNLDLVLEKQKSASNQVMTNFVAFCYNM